MRRVPLLVAAAGLVLLATGHAFAAGGASGLSGRIYYAGPSEACAADESPCAYRPQVWSISPSGTGNRFESALEDTTVSYSLADLPVLSHRNGLLAYFKSAAAYPPRAVLTTTPRGGGATRQLSTPPGDNRSPAWSRDDRWIAFLHYGSAAGHSPSVWVVSSAGGVARQVASAEVPPVMAGSSGVLNAQYPEWSPDGRWITFPRKTAARGALELWAVSTTGAHLHQLTHLHLVESYYHEPGCASCGTYLTGGPTFIWSSRGRLAVVTRDGIFLADGALQRVTRIASPGAYDPLFSPSGSAILFLRDSSAPAPGWGSDYKSSSIYSVDTSGHGARRITTGNHLDQAPAWSPDGRWIAFSRDQALWIVSSRGTDAHYLPGQARPRDSGYGPYNTTSVWLP